MPGTEAEWPSDSAFYQVESAPLSTAKVTGEHVVDDDWEPYSDSVPTSPGEGARPAPLAPLAPLRLAKTPPADDLDVADVPEDPTIPLVSQPSPTPPAPLPPAPAPLPPTPAPLPPAPAPLPPTPPPRAPVEPPRSFHRDQRPSARMRALSSAIEDEVSRVDIEPVVPPRPSLPAAPIATLAGGSLPPLLTDPLEPTGDAPIVMLPPTPSSVALPMPFAPPSDLEEPDDVAPLTLADTGISVLLPAAPIEEISASRRPAPELAPLPPRRASRELAPISQRPRSAAQFHGSALRAGASSGSSRLVLFGAIGAAVLGILGLAAWWLLR